MDVLMWLQSAPKELLVDLESCSLAVIVFPPEHICRRRHVLNILFATLLSTGASSGGSLFGAAPSGGLVQNMRIQTWMAVAQPDRVTLL